MQTGQKLQTLRMQKNMTQEQLAEKLYVSRELVSKWELGQRRPNIRLLRDLSALFGVGIDELTDTGAF
ncbi:MAG: helix-turn-helix transcriptional regulator, partial [Clostridia bacterium]|nr:helix-turn-helix transcriptional regulator [Clostridia bacterium]